MSEARWDDDFFVGAYDLAAAGFDEFHMASVFGMSDKAMRDWVIKKPALRKAIDRGKKRFDDPKNYNAFRDYAYGRLPQHLQELWDRIDLCDQTDNGVRRCEHLLEKAGETARMHFFLYALVHTGFNMNKACQKLSISKRRLDEWVKRRPDFAELVDELHWHKGNYYESALMDGVESGNPNLVMFANRTFNRERGYGDVKKHVVEGQVNSQVTVTHKLGTLDADTIRELPGEVAIALLKAMRAKSEASTQGRIGHFVESNGDQRAAGYDSKAESGQASEDYG